MASFSTKNIWWRAFEDTNIYNEPRRNWEGEIDSDVAFIIGVTETRPDVYYINICAADTEWNLNMHAKFGNYIDVLPFVDSLVVSIEKEILND